MKVQIRTVIVAILATAIIITGAPTAAIAAKNVYVYGPGYTGPRGRVLDGSYVANWVTSGYTFVQTVNTSTTPDAPMFPVTQTVNYTNGAGWPSTMVIYVDHEQLFTPSPFPGVIESGQTRSSSLYSWGPSTIVP